MLNHRPYRAVVENKKPPFEVVFYFQAFKNNHSLLGALKVVY